MPFASYAVDIGIYNVGANGRILSSTTTAWARSVEGTTSFEGIGYSGSCDVGKFSGSAGREWSCGRSIGPLVDSIAADIKAGFPVSLGVEAPMWFPIWRDHSASLKLFKRRFADEQGSEWYLQSGAAATVKALSIVSMLIGLLASKQPAVKLTTNPNSATDQTIVLYEAFVVGKFKTPRPASLTDSHVGNEWDAFTASLAWGAINAAFSIPPSVRHQELHKAGSSECGIASVWQIVAGLVPSKLSLEGPLDCQIVGLTKIDLPK